MVCTKAMDGVNNVFMGIILYIYIHIFTNMQTCQKYLLWLFATKLASCQDNPFTAISSDPETSSSEKGDRTDGYRDDKRCTGPPVMTAKAKRWSRWGWPVGHDLFLWDAQVPGDRKSCHHDDLADEFLKLELWTSPIVIIIICSSETAIQLQLR